MMTLTAAALDFLAPAFLWALIPALALPLIAHLLVRRRSGPRLILPTTRFLREARIDRGRRLGLSELLLLIARIAIASLIVLAFAQPVWLTSSVFGSNPRGRGGGRDVIIIIDASASMRRRAPLTTWFEQAKQQAIDLLASGRLDPATDRAAVILAGLHPEPLLPKMTANFSTLAERLKSDETSCTLEAANLDAAAAKAIDMLRADHSSGSEHGGQILIITDGQASTLDTLRASAPLPGNVSLEIDSLAPTQPGQSNVFESALIRMSSSQADRAALAGRTVEVGCTLLNPTARTEQALLNITPTFADTRAAPLAPIVIQVRLDPMGAASVSAGVPIPSDAQPGAMIIAAELTDAAGREDDFPFDNRMSVEVPVRSSACVGVIGRPDVRTSAGDHNLSYFVSAALDPGASGESAETPSGSQFRVTALHPASGTATFADQLRSCDAVIIADHASELSLESLRVLHDAIADRGIGVFWMIDSPAAAQTADAFASIEPDRTTIPFRFTGMMEPLTTSQPESRSFKSIDTHDPQSPLRFFDGNGSAAAALNAITFRPTMQVALNDSARSFIFDSAGQPALARIALGCGQIMMLNGDCSPASGSPLVKQPIFVPFINELTASLCSPVSGAEAVEIPVANVGEPMLLTWPDSTIGHREDTFQVDAMMSGDATSHHITARRSTDDPTGLWALSSGGWPQPGRLRIVDPEHPQQTLTWGIVRIDPRESDLTPAEPGAVEAQISRLMNSNPTPASASGGMTPSSAPAIIRTNNAIDLWPYAIVMALIVFALESVIILLSRRRESRLTQPRLITA